MTVDGETIPLGADEVLVQTEARGELAIASDKGVTVAVDTHLTPELIQEGYARDLVRHVNSMRKEAGLEISDHITLAYQADGDVAAAMTRFADYLRQETLTADLIAGSLDASTYTQTVRVGDQDVTLALQKHA